MADRRVDICSWCRAPLVWTFDFTKYEYYCLDCGRHYGMFGPTLTVEPDEELLDIEQRYRDEYRVLREGLIPPGALLQSCVVCVATNNTHEKHATVAEWVADGEARERLDARVVIR